MNAFPIAKVLTVVMVVLFTSFGWGAEEGCGKMTNGETVNSSSRCEKYKDKGDSVVGECIRIIECLEEKRKEKDENKELKAECTTAVDKYNEAAVKQSQACQAFDKTNTGDTCQTKMNDCKQKVEAFGRPFDSSEGSGDQSSSKAWSDIATMAIYQKFKIPTDQPGLLPGQGACVRSIDRSKRAQDKKDKERERKDLLDKIKTQKDDITKYAEELNVKRNEINEKIAEIEKANKDEIAKNDKAMREESAKISKNSVDVGKRLRSYALAVTKEMQNLANVNFEYQSSLLEMTDDNIHQKCQAEFNKMKSGIVKSRMTNISSSMTAEKKREYEALAEVAEQYKGIKGTGELSKMLLNARKACFERAYTGRNKAKLVNAQNVKNIQDKIDEMKNLIADENKNVSLEAENIQKLQQETAKAKATDEEDKNTKLDNLNKKLSDLIQTTAAKTQSANEKIAELNAQINKLTLADKEDVEIAFGEADEAIVKSRESLKNAWIKCGCKVQDKPKSKQVQPDPKSKPNPNQETCIKLQGDNEDFAGRGKKDPTSTKK